MAFPRKHVFDKAAGCVVDGVEWALGVGCDRDQSTIFVDALAI
jgi:hypothetical protein